MRDNANLSVIQPTVHINISIGKVSGEIEKLEISKDSLELADYKAQSFLVHIEPYSLPLRVEKPNTFYISKVA